MATWAENEYKKILALRNKRLRDINWRNAQLKNAALTSNQRKWHTEVRNKYRAEVVKYNERLNNLKTTIAIQKATLPNIKGVKELIQKAVKQYRSERASGNNKARSLISFRRRLTNVYNQAYNYMLKMGLPPQNARKEANKILKSMKG